MGNSTVGSFDIGVP